MESILATKPSLSPERMERVTEAERVLGGVGRMRGTGEMEEEVTAVRVLPMPGGSTRGEVRGTTGEVEVERGRGAMPGWCCWRMMEVYCLIWSSCCAIMPFSLSMACRSSLSF